ncbi:MAG: DNA gyrase subunit A, partial [Firmicutes bacterium]|nr:DNA gyrase subunit A [Bacillota bacterium]
MADQLEGKVVPIDLEHEMRRSYITYAMSVIVDRALPDVRDGLKPVQRRILYGMRELGLDPDKPHKKSARIVGEVMGKYHPHGDMAIYDSMVRMAQDFSYRYPLVDGHGNFGSVDGDPPAAPRYTEARLSGPAMYMLADIDKDTVPFVPNFDETLEQPAVLPSRFPNLLVNGAEGIAVGMATNIPPHNLGEVVDALTYMIDHPDATLQELMRFIKGPDFPTGAVILGRDGIRSAYETGRGSIKVRAKVHIEETHGNRQQLVVTELPYMVNKAALIENIAQLVRERKVDGITDLRDESDREGMRVVMELRRDVQPRVVLNQLFKHTQMQDTYGAILLALVDGTPRILGLRDMLYYYLEHQRDVVTRRSRFELAKAEERAHILEGLRIALDHLDEVIAIIRGSHTDEEAKQALMERLALSEKQAVAILDMRLRRLTGLEREKLEEEFAELQKTIAYLRSLLADPALLMGVVKKELLAVKERFGDARRTEIQAQVEDELDEEDLIHEEQIVVTITHQGYIKRCPVAAYRVQRRGGRGITAVTTREEDFVEHLFVNSTHDYLLIFTDRGRVFRMKGHEVPEAGRSARGTALVNLLPVDRGEIVSAVIPVRSFEPDLYLVMGTRQGVVKRTALSEFTNIRANGLTAIQLAEGDQLVGVRLVRDDAEIILVTAHGQAIRFPVSDVRPMGRSARGVRGIQLEGGDQVVGMDTVRPGAQLLVVTRYGFGKRTPLSEYRVQSRGGKGLKTLRLTQKNGPIVGIKATDPGQEIMVITASGIMIRTTAESVSQTGRDTQGVKVIALDAGDTVVALAQLAREQDDH